MTTTADTAPATKAPWHFWLVALVGLFWNGFGAFDYTMSHVQGVAYFRQMGMTDAQIAYFKAYPSWMHGVGAIGVWGSALGAILLLGRSKWAFHAFAVSLLGAVGNVLYLAANPGGGGLGLPLAIIAICLFFIWYAWTMTKRGVLR